MKKLLLIIFVCSGFLAACKKNVSELPVVKQESFKKYPVSFTVSDFSQTTQPISFTGDKQNLALKAVNTFIPYETQVSKITYVAYDTTGVEVSRLEQSTTESNKLFRVTATGRRLINSSAAFGSLTDSLQAGNYTIAIMGGGSNSALNAPTSTNGGTVPYVKSSLTDARFYPTRDVFPYAEDAFLYKGRIIVGSTNKPQIIGLNRIVGQLALNFEDGVPAGTYYGRFIINNNNTTYRINTGQTEGKIADNQEFITAIAESDKAPNKPLLFYILSNNNYIDVTVTMADAGGRVLVTKTIPHILIQPNKRTLVTGKLMSVSSAFTITPNYAWDGQTVIKF